MSLTLQSEVNQYRTYLEILRSLNLLHPFQAEHLADEVKDVEKIVSESEIWRRLLQGAQKILDELIGLIPILITLSPFYITVTPSSEEHAFVIHFNIPRENYEIFWSIRVYPSQEPPGSCEVLVKPIFILSKQQPLFKTINLQNREQVEKAKRAFPELAQLLSIMEKLFENLSRRGIRVVYE